MLWLLSLPFRLIGWVFKFTFGVVGLVISLVVGLVLFILTGGLALLFVPLGILLVAKLISWLCVGAGR